MHSNWPSMIISEMMKPLYAYIFAMFKTLYRSVGALLFPIISTIVNLISLKELMKKLMRLTDIISNARMTFLYLVKTSCGQVMVFPLACIDFLLVVLPFKHFRLQPKISSTLSMSLTVYGQLSNFLVCIIWWKCS